MKGISEETLKTWLWKEYRLDIKLALNDLIKQCQELDAWKPIDESTPKDRLILVYAPGCDGLDYLITTCLWHDDAGFCIDMIREPTYWTDLPTLPKEKL